MSKEQKETSVENILKTAKIKADKKGNYSMEIIYDEVQTLPTNEVITTPSTKFPPKCPHQDMFKALRLLVPHLLIETEFRDSKDFNNSYFEQEKAVEDKTLENFKVTGIHVKEKNEQRHVILVGRKVLRTGRVINLSPMINIDNLEDGYVYAENLSAGVDRFIQEVELYMGGKVAEDPQMKMFPEKEEDHSIDIEAEAGVGGEEEVKKKSSKKLKVA